MAMHLLCSWPRKVLHVFQRIRVRFSWRALPHVPACLSIRGEWPCEIGPVRYDSKWCAEKTDVSWSDRVHTQEQRAGDGRRNVREYCGRLSYS